MPAKSADNPAKVLVVEDEIEYQDLFKAILSSSFSVTVCSNAEDALIEAKKHDFNLIIVDLFLYGESGFTFVEKFLESKPSKKVPIIVASGISDLATQKKAKELGVAGFVAKPFQNDALLATVRKFVDGSH